MGVWFGFAHSAEQRLTNQSIKALSTGLQELEVMLNQRAHMPKQCYRSGSMSAREGSPNWHWHRHGYTVVRDGLHRTILDPDGNQVLHDAGYDGELQWINDNLESEDD